MGKVSFVRAQYGGDSDVQVRVPELAPLRQATVAIFGLGCIGAPIAFELARAGIGKLRLIDSDLADPATIARWPLGLSASGGRKCEVLRDFIEANYPETEVEPTIHRVGRVRLTPDVPSEEEVIDRILENATIVVDATAESGVQHFLSECTRARRINYVGASGTYGGWGGRVFRFRPRQTEGCWLCLRQALHEGTIEEPPSAPTGEVQPPGCEEPTFTGAGFDMSTVSLWATRVIVSTVCNGVATGYPEISWDVTTIKLRDERGGLIPPAYIPGNIPKNPRCPTCSQL